jgi:exonuclease SbcC
LPELNPRELSDPQDLCDNLTQRKKETDSQIVAHKADLEIESTEDLERLAEQIESESKAIYTAYGDYKNYRDRLKNKEKEEKLLNEIAKRLKKLPEQLDKQKVEAKELEHIVDKLELKIENHRLVAQLDDYRHKLKDGEACPLCGSTEHPFSTHEYPPGALQKLEEELHDIKRKKSALEKEILENEQVFKTTESEKKRIEDQIVEHISIIDTTKSKLDEVFPKWREIENWEELKVDYEQKLQSIKSLQKLIVNAENLQKAIGTAENMIEISKQGQEVSSKLKSIYPGNDIEHDVDLLLSRWQSSEEAISAAAERLEKGKKEIGDADIAHAKLSKKLGRLVKENGFSDLQAAREARMGEEEYEKLKQSRDELEKNAVDHRTKMTTIHKTLEDLKSKFESEESLDELKQKHASVKSELTEHRESLQHTNNILSLRQKCEEQIQRLNEEIQQEGKTARKWQLLHTMIGDAKGSKFNQFAQDLTLDQLLILGNQRLKGLTDRYRMARPNREEDEALVIVDKHMAGMRRSVQTLSGGETFLMSLSLALALSDMASRKIEINSLFVDEGFGTLDPETLDQTLDTLEKLQDEGNKTIGIISHVDALKERISTQIQLERNSLGNSSMQIVG